MTTSATPDLSYFAYGANLCVAHMKIICPRSAPEGPARLEDHRLVIALPASAPRNGPGWATVTPEAGARVPGALFRLHPDDLPTLDRFENFPTLYGRETMEVTTAEGRAEAMLYVMPAPLRAARPTARYIELLRQGYTDFGLPPAALESALAGSRF